MTTSTSKRPIWLWLIPLLLLATWFGARGLGADALWFDEVRSMQRAGQPQYGGPFPPAEVWERTAQISDQVPGYYILLSGWGSLVGLTDYGGRALSLLLGVLAIAAIYRLGRDLHSVLAGLGAAVALTSSAFYIMYLHELRAYALVVCLTVLMLWLYWRIINGKKDRWTQIGLVLSTTGLLYSHYFAAVMIVAVCLYHLLFVPKNREWWRVVILMGLAGILFLPWFLTSFLVFEDTRRLAWHSVGGWPIGVILTNLGDRFSNANIGLLVLLGVFAAQMRRRGVGLVWFVLLVALGLAIVLNEWVGFLTHLRYILLIWVPLALLAGFGVAGIARLGVRPRIILSLLLIIGTWNTLQLPGSEYLTRPVQYLPWPQLVRVIEGRNEPDDLMLFLISVEDDDWGGFHKHVMAHYFMGIDIETALVESLPKMRDEAYLQSAVDALRGIRRVWLSLDPEMRPWREGMLLDTLAEQGFTRCGNITDTPELVVDMYAHAPVDTRALTLRYGADGPPDTIWLEPLESLPVRVSDSLPVVQGWILGDAVPRQTYSVALHVEDGAGNLVAQMDYGLPADAFGCVADTLDVSQLPAGDYTLLAAVYAWETGDRLTGQDTASGESGERLVLGTFTVE